MAKAFGSWSRLGGGSRPPSEGEKDRTRGALYLDDTTVTEANVPLISKTDDIFEDVVGLFCRMNDGERVVVVRFSSRALDTFDLSGRGRRRHETFARLRNRIEAAARLKYEMGDVQADGSVYVTQI